jgi:hypothetical protein
MAKWYQVVAENKSSKTKVVNLISFKRVVFHFKCHSFTQIQKYRESVWALGIEFENPISKSILFSA